MAVAAAAATKTAIRFVECSQGSPVARYLHMFAAFDYQSPLFDQAVDSAKLNSDAAKNACTHACVFAAIPGSKLIVFGVRIKGRTAPRGKRGAFYRINIGKRGEEAF